MRDSAVIDEERFSVVVLTCLRYRRSHNIYSYAADARKRIQKTPITLIGIIFNFLQLMAHIYTV